MPLFKCAWVENEKCIKYDDDTGLTMVNLNRRGYRKDEFVMATHVSQVFYIDDPENDGGSIVLPIPNRVYVRGDELEDVVLEHQSFTNGLPSVEEFKYELGEGDTNGIKQFNAEKGRGLRRPPTWIMLSGAPKQANGKTCGYCVMRYMKEICEDSTLAF
ncbi:hypothetical protein L3X38_024293 [Prunus dulcis]|uniref:DUF4216 domain-containing protein n=1 Tax=Prunus dulcis TaxID=3755 RepID=A0AAD4VZJ9_PRUDU|nr:hypothetical protein L3X38_024293 [Prunus dulcis]